MNPCSQLCTMYSFLCKMLWHRKLKNIEVFIEKFPDVNVIYKRVRKLTQTCDTTVKVKKKYCSWGIEMMEFCLIMGENVLENWFFFWNILFRDESTFITNRIVSSQNCRNCAQENPYFRINTYNKKFKMVNVFYGII